MAWAVASSGRRTLTQLTGCPYRPDHVGEPVLSDESGEFSLECFGAPKPDLNPRC
jgi:hypothetical protein